MNHQTIVDTTFFHWIFPKEQILPREMPQSHLDELLREVSVLFLAKDLSKFELSSFQAFLEVNQSLEKIVIAPSVSLQAVKVVQDLLNAYPTVCPILELKDRDLQKEKLEDLRAISSKHIVVTQGDQTFPFPSYQTEEEKLMDLLVEKPVDQVSVLEELFPGFSKLKPEAQQTILSLQKDYESLKQKIMTSFENGFENEYTTVNIAFVFFEGTLKTVTTAEKMTPHGKINLFEEVLPVHSFLDKTFLEPVLHAYALYHPVVSADLKEQWNLAVIASDNTNLNMNHLPTLVQERLLTMAKTTKPTKYQKPEYAKYEVFQEVPVAKPFIKKLEQQGYTHIRMVLILSFVLGFIVILCLP